MIHRRLALAFAIVVMGGLVTSTLLTLLVVPLVYFMVVGRQHERPLPAAWTATAKEEEEG